MKNGLTSLFTAALFLLFATLAVLQPRTLQYPFLKIDVSTTPVSSENLTLTFLIESQPTGAHCSNSHFDLKVKYEGFISV